MKLSFKTYAQGDERELTELWNRAYARYGGFFAKTEERWRWSILQCGAVTPGSIIIATLAGRVSAYGALAATGAIIEFAVDTMLKSQQRREICIALIEKLEDRARELQCASLSFVSPQSDAIVDLALRKMGYVAEHGDYFMLGILNPTMLVNSLLSHPDHRLPTTWNRRILIDTPPGGYPVALQSKILIEVERGYASVTDASGKSPESIAWHFKIDFVTLTNLIFRLTDFRRAVAEHRMELDARCTAAEAEIFFTALRIRADWYTPSSDGFF